MKKTKSLMQKHFNIDKFLDTKTYPKKDKPSTNIAKEVEVTVRSEYMTE